MEDFSRRDAGSAEELFGVIADDAVNNNLNAEVAKGQRNAKINRLQNRPRKNTDWTDGRGYEQTNNSSYLR
jgi:hypothetical protein